MMPSQNQKATLKTSCLDDNYYFIFDSSRNKIRFAKVVIVQCHK